MKRKLLSILLALVLLLPMLVFPTSASAAGTAGRWFSGQLTDQGKAIYNALVRMYDSGLMKDGRTSFDLAGSGVPGAADQYATVSQAAIADYRNGNRTLFNDFAAAKDAFDLEHPEAWYVDSSYLSFRVTVDDSGVLHAYMGAGRPGRGRQDRRPGAGPAFHRHRGQGGEHRRHELRRGGRRPGPVRPRRRHQGHQLPL